MSNILIAPLEALTDSLLSDPERRVLLALFSWRGKTTNTVWPSLGEIGLRANISDITRISKITSSLADKGWLTKKKRGFTGCNEYTLTFPDRLEIDSSNLDSDTKLGSETKLAQDTNSNLDSDTNSNLDSDTKYKEQTNEQTIEQTSIKKNKQKNVLDFSCWPELPEQQVMDDWIAMRKRAKADVSQTVINRFGKELHKAKTFGFSVDHCLTECVTRNWRGFECQWLLNSSGGASNHAANQQRGGIGASTGKSGAADLIRTQARQFFEQNGSTGSAAVRSTG